MSIKKKKPVRRPAPRRTTYDIAREHAATRLGKAIDERTECLKKLDQLAYEIPYLENIVSALSGPETAPAPPAVLPQNRSPQPEPYSAPTAAPVPQTPVIMDQEEYLQRF
ncbi:MAG: hypothetical protein J2P31_13270, partial [Blastocatellia bacterium]|nr:hypothetical protein [Blastocatellia bacterium]